MVVVAGGSFVFVGALVGHDFGLAAVFLLFGGELLGNGGVFVNIHSFPLHHIPLLTLTRSKKPSLSIELSLIEPLLVDVVTIEVVDVQCVSLLLVVGIVEVVDGLGFFGGAFSFVLVVGVELLFERWEFGDLLILLRNQKL